MALGYHVGVNAKENTMTRISTFCVASSTLAVLALSANAASAAGTHGSGGGGGGAGKAVTGTTTANKSLAKGKHFDKATLTIRKASGKASISEISVTKSTDPASVK
jgi:hypothetical protein